MGAMRLELGALTTARAREFWGPGDLRLGQVVIKRVAVVKVGVNNGTGNGGSCFGIEVWLDHGVKDGQSSNKNYRSVSVHSGFYYRGLCDT